MPLNVTKTATFSWSISENIGVDWTLIKEVLSASVGFSATDTWETSTSVSYSPSLAPGQKGKIVYIPMVHRVEGVLTATVGGDRVRESNGDGGWFWDITPVTTIIDHKPVTIITPIPDQGQGQYQLEFLDGPAARAVSVYDEPHFSGNRQDLTPGSYDWGQISNDAISSLSVPEGMQAELYTDTHFAGRKLTLTKDTPELDQDWNDQISSIIIVQ